MVRAVQGRLVEMALAEAPAAGRLVGAAARTFRVYEADQRLLMVPCL